MREQITFAVDVMGFAHYVSISLAMKRQLSIEEAGAVIDEWPGDFPGNLKPGFYSATLDVSGTLDNPVLKWTKVQKMTAFPPSVKVTELPERKEKESHNKKEVTEKPHLAVRIRRNGQIL